MYVGSMLSICGGLGVGLAVFFYTREYRHTVENNSIIMITCKLR